MLDTDVWSCENVLDGTKRSYYGVWCEENVLGSTKLNVCDKMMGLPAYYKDFFTRDCPLLLKILL